MDQLSTGVVETRNVPMRSASREMACDNGFHESDYGAKLKVELDNHYAPNEAEAVYRMLGAALREDVKIPRRRRGCS